jgi:hypothetical protein
MPLDQPTSYLSPELEARANHQGHAVYAKQTIGAGEILVVWGGEVVTHEQFAQVPARLQRISVQVEEELFLVPGEEGPADWVNHACDPNAGMFGQIALVAMRDIEAGEEVRYDYAMSDGSPYDEFSCRCGAGNCRHRVAGSDWRQPELWVRYRGYFSPYLQRRIDRLRAHLQAHGEAMQTTDVP